MFTSTTLSHAKLEDIQKLLQLPYWNDENYEKYEELGDTLTKLQRESLTQNDETELVSNNRGLK